MVKSVSWVKLSPHPSVFLILGDVGTGKTHTACSIMDEFHKKSSSLKFYMLGDKHVVKNYPQWIQHKDPQAPFIPQNSVAFLDDAHLHFYSREWYKTNKVLDFIARERRQSGNSIIYTTQQGRALDITLLSMASCVILFRYSKLQYQFERKELKAMIDKSEPALKEVGYKKGYAYVFSTDHEGLVKIPKLTWFTGKISKAQKRVIEDKAPKKNYVEEGVNLIKTLGRIL